MSRRGWIGLSVGALVVLIGVAFGLRSWLEMRAAERAVRTYEPAPLEPWSAEPCDVQTARATLESFETWDAASPETRRAVAAFVAASFDDLELAGGARFECGGVRREVAVLRQAITIESARVSGFLEYSLVPGERVPGPRNDDGTGITVRVAPFLIARAEYPERLFHWELACSEMELSSGERASERDDRAWATMRSWWARNVARSLGGRLPTAAEWTLAAFAGVRADFPWGREPGDALDYAWCALNVPQSGPSAPPPLVATKLPNAMGLFDMVGNMAEWTVGESSPASESLRHPDVGVDGFAGYASLGFTQLIGGALDWRPEQPVAGHSSVIGGGVRLVRSLLPMFDGDSAPELEQAPLWLAGSEVRLCELGRRIERATPGVRFLRLEWVAPRRLIERPGRVSSQPTEERLPVAVFQHLSTSEELALVPGSYYLEGPSPYEIQALLPPRNETRRFVLVTEPFLIARTEFTRGQWRRLRGEAPAADDGFPATGHGPDEVEALLASVGMQLPTEAQWELAARGFSRHKWYFTMDSVSDLTSECIHSVETTRGALQPAGVLVPNVFGLHDVIGNAAEMCRDDWSMRGTAPAIDALHRDPDGRNPVLRGGSVWNTLDDLDVARREPLDPDSGWPRPREYAELLPEVTGFRPIVPISLPLR